MPPEVVTSKLQFRSKAMGQLCSLHKIYFSILSGGRLIFFCIYIPDLVRALIHTRTSMGTFCFQTITTRSS